MHGFHIAKTILKKIKTLNTAAKRFKVKIGVSLAVPEEELLFGFAELVKGTPDRDIQLTIETVPLQAVCSDCQKPFSPQELRLTCPNCQSGNIKISSGDGVEVTEK